MTTWKLQDAKARFSEVVDLALSEGPQIVTRHGENVVVIVPYGTFAEATQASDFKAFLVSAPWEEIDLRRRAHLPREDEFD